MWLEFLLSDQIIGHGLQIYEIENVSALTGNVNALIGNAGIMQSFYFFRILKVTD